ncbi:MAG: alanine--tRNA ligase, partial [Thermodesulfovibrionia bacterium]|nr:alanine--tRNA ligase [Thermodesulfovibrionia bacterium]
NVETQADLKTLRRNVADRLKISIDELNCNITPMENLYVICDHSRALMFLLQDGVLPSNVKEGYFARLLVRRTLRALDFLNLDIPLPEIVKLQVDYFKRDFPELSESGDELMGLVDVEVEKYKKTIKKGRGIVKRLEEGVIKKDGLKKIELNDLIDLYDSHGLTPDTVAEFSSLSVEIPDDFYIKVTEKHEKPEVERKDLKKIEIPGGIPATYQGYYEDSDVMCFKARVLAVFNNYVILDKTYFYPEGGGQETDHGKIDDMPVIDVQKVGSVIVHKLKVKGDLDNSSNIKEGGTVNCEIDQNRRTQLMQHHTATHILNGAARKVLGNHVWQTGAHKSVKGARLDITHYASLSQEESEEIETLANEIINENRNIEIRFMKRNDAEKKYGFRLYQGGAVPGGEIRIINIRDWDIEACGGMHFNSTGDVGHIIITGSKRIQDGVVRLEFVAGDAAKRYVEKEMDLYRGVCECVRLGA